jgi:hypothetical protein
MPWPLLNGKQKNAGSFSDPLVKVSREKNPVTFLSVFMIDRKIGHENRSVMQSAGNY